MSEENVINRDFCLFYKSYMEAGAKLKDPEKELQFYKDIFAYGTTKKEPDYSEDPLLDIAWTFVKPLLDANIRNYFNGRKGGAPSESMKGNQNARKQTQNKPKQTQNEGKVTVTDTDKVTVTVTDTDTVNTSLSAATPEVQPPKGKVIILDEDDDESTYTRDVELLKRQWQEQQQRELTRNEN